jgi:hypothetical protein
MLTDSSEVPKYLFQRVDSARLEDLDALLVDHVPAVATLEFTVGASQWP